MVFSLVSEGIFYACRNLSFYPSKFQLSSHVDQKPVHMRAIFLQTKMDHQQFTLNQGTGKLFSIAADSLSGSYFRATKALPTTKTGSLERKHISDVRQSFDSKQAFQMLNQKLGKIAIDYQAMRIQLDKLSKSEPLKEVTKEELERP